MSAPVDVLAVLGLSDCRQGSRAVGHCGPEDDEWEAYVEAPLTWLTAVAELIEAADNAARTLHNVIGARQIGAGYQSNLDDLNSALARVHPMTREQQAAETERRA